MLDRLTTEQRNPASASIDRLDAKEIVQLMSREDATVAQAVATQTAAIAQAIDAIVARMRRGGRLLYIGAGTSGRLGVLDAAECPPTFRTPPELVVGIIAGGSGALTRAVEGAEDHPEYAAKDLRRHTLAESDVLVGIATSGRTPYVIGGLQFAATVGAFRIGLSCNDDSKLSEVAQLMITPVVGPEIISGSTRLKAGTATKMVLNMLTTGTMVRLGKTYGNLMVDLLATNNKLMERSRNIVHMLTGISHEAAGGVLQRCAGEVKTAIVVQRLAVTPDEARHRLREVDGHLHRLLDEPPTRDSPADADS